MDPHPKSVNRLTPTVLNVKFVNAGQLKPSELLDTANSGDPLKSFSKVTCIIRNEGSNETDTC